MSAYSNQMVTELCASAHTYESAVAFASKHNLSTRSVVSKIKSLGLDYERKVVVSVSQTRIRKSDVVAEIAARLSLESEKLAGLSKADTASLQELLKAI